MEPRELSEGDVVQIDPMMGAFGGCLMIVSESKLWGAQGYVRIPGKGDAYYRCLFANMEFVGRAAWVTHDGDSAAVAGPSTTLNEPGG